jgi:hypothetical protein
VFTTTRPETIPAALVALVVIAATILAALGVDVPTFLPYLAIGGAGAVFGVTQPGAAILTRTTSAPVAVAPLEAAPAVPVVAPLGVL